MTSSLILLPDAKTDVHVAYHWYEEQRSGLGAEFLQCVEAVLLSIKRTPRVHPVVHEDYRRALLQKFPYALFFEFDESSDQCVVFSVFHCSQDPAKWQSRLPGSK